VVIKAIGLNYRKVFWQVKVASVSTDRMLLNVFNLECIEDMSKGFFERGSLFAFDFATPRAIGIAAALYGRRSRHKCLVTDRTLFLESDVNSSAVALVRAEFMRLIFSRLASSLKRYSAIFALVLDAYVVRLPIKSLALRRAKVFEVRLHSAGASYKATPALWTSGLRAAKSIKARTATEVAVIALRLVFGGLKIASACGAIDHNVCHKKSLLL
jgi:hypothetical protein